jgi:hypothetical protein
LEYFPYDCYGQFHGDFEYGDDDWFGIALGTDDGVNNFYEFEIQFKFDESADNQYQGKSATLATTFFATQKNKAAILDEVEGNISDWNAERVANQVYPE